METTYKVSMIGALLADPYGLLKVVFPQWNGEPAESNGSFVLVTFASQQSHVDLGPLVKVEVFDPNTNSLLK